MKRLPGVDLSVQAIVIWCVQVNVIRCVQVNVIRCVQIIVILSVSEESRYPSREILR